MELLGQLMPSRLYDRIYAVVRAIPPGTVMTYGEVGLEVGCPARVVGYALHQLSHHPELAVPWQRVVNRQGGISTSGLEQRRLLEAEGVEFEVDGTLDLRRYRWQSAREEMV